MPSMSDFLDREEFQHWLNCENYKLDVRDSQVEVATGVSVTVPRPGHPAISPHQAANLRVERKADDDWKSMVSYGAKFRLVEYCGSRCLEMLPLSTSNDTRDAFYWKDRTDMPGSAATPARTQIQDSSEPHRRGNSMQTPSSTISNQGPSSHLSSAGNQSIRQTTSSQSTRQQLSSPSTSTVNQTARQTTYPQAMRQQMAGMSNFQTTTPQQRPLQPASTQGPSSQLSSTSNQTAKQTTLTHAARQQAPMSAGTSSFQTTRAPQQQVASADTSRFDSTATPTQRLLQPTQMIRNPPALQLPQAQSQSQQAFSMPSSRGQPAASTPGRAASAQARSLMRGYQAPVAPSQREQSALSPQRPPTPRQTMSSQASQSRYHPEIGSQQAYLAHSQPTQRVMPAQAQSTATQAMRSQAFHPRHYPQVGGYQPYTIPSRRSQSAWPAQRGPIVEPSEAMTRPPYYSRAQASPRAPHSLNPPEQIRSRSLAPTQVQEPARTGTSLVDSTLYPQQSQATSPRNATPYGHTGPQMQQGAEPGSSEPAEPDIAAIRRAFAQAQRSQAGSGLSRSNTYGGAGGSGSDVGMNR